jgi:hypothetical protein
LSFDIFHLTICQQTQLDQVKRSLREGFPMTTMAK